MALRVWYRQTGQWRARVIGGIALITGVCCAVTLALAQETRYRVHLLGTDDPELRKVVEGESALFRLQEEPPPSLVGLERRAEADRESLLAVLRAHGHYNGTIRVDIDSSSEPAAVTIAVEAGPLYRIGRVTLGQNDGTPVPETVTADSIGLAEATPARAHTVVTAQEKLVERLAALGFGYAQVGDRQVVVDHDHQTMDIVFNVAPGPKVRFGPLRVEGLEEVDENLVRGRMGWQQGDVYDPMQLEKTRARLVALGVFDSVRIGLDENPSAVATGAPDSDSVAAPVVIKVAERKRRYIGAGVSLSTSEGFATTAYWGHRNLFGGGEQLQVAAQMGRVGSKNLIDTRKRFDHLINRSDFQIAADFRKPDMFTLNQTLILSAVAVSEQPAAYTRRALVLTGRLERALSEGLTVGYGITVEQSRIAEPLRATSSSLAGMPLLAALDRTDTQLDPRRGYRLALEATPYLQTGASKKPFIPTRLTGSAYYDLTGEGRHILAGRFALGSIIDGETSDIPADKRFYAGGGSSIRGFGYQKVGPRNAAGDPAGGRSLVEVGVEARLRVTDTIGVVPFLDGGNVYDSVSPRFGQDMRWGTGLGVRYYTDFGPLRVDVGVPLNRRPGDSRWELYLSLGQAF